MCIRDSILLYDAIHKYQTVIYGIVLPLPKGNRHAFRKIQAKLFEITVPLLAGPWLRSGHDDERRASFNAAVSLLLFGWEVPGLPQHGVVLRHAAAIAA